MAARLFRSIGPSRKGAELFVKKISWVTGAKELTDHFSQFGKINNITLPFDLKTGLHKGFAFISFQNNDFGENIKKFKGKHIIDDEELICSLVGEEKLLLLTDANATPLGNRDGNNNNSETDVAKTNSDTEIGTDEIRMTQKNIEEEEMRREASQKKVTLKNINVRNRQEQTKEVMKMPKNDNLERDTRKLSRNGRMLNNVMITNLTDSVKEIREGNSGTLGQGYTVVRLSNNSKVDVLRNSFSGHNGSRRDFKNLTSPVTKRSYDENVSNLDGIKETVLVNSTNQRSESLKTEMNMTVSSEKGDRS